MSNTAELRHDEDLLRQTQSCANQVVDVSQRYPENIEAAWSHEPDLEELWAATSELTRNPKAALRRLQRLAELGSALSAMYIGDALIYGRGVPKNVKSGEKWLRKSTEQGSIEGAYRLSKHFLESEQSENALNLLHALRKKGFAPAIWKLGMMHLEGEYFDKNNDVAMGYLREAESLGHIVSKHWISWILRKDSESLKNKFRGFLKIPSLIITGVYYRMRYPDSDKLRSW